MGIGGHADVQLLKTLSGGAAAAFAALSALAPLPLLAEELAADIVAAAAACAAPRIGF